MAANFEEMRVAILEEIAEYDKVLDAAQDPGTAGKRKIGNELVDERKDSWSKVTTPLIQQLREIEDPRSRVGSYLGFIREMNAAFKDESDSFIQSLFDAQPKAETSSVDEAAVKEAATKRSEAYTNFKKLRDVVLAWDDDLTPEDIERDWKMPPVRRANVGKRGKRALSVATWTVDGTELDPNETTPKDVAVLLGFEKKDEPGGSVSGQLTAALKAAGINTTKPGAGTFEVEVNGHTVAVSFPEGTPGPDDDSSDEDDESEDGSEEE